MLPPFALARPASVDDAIDLLEADRDEGRRVPYCGGTELLLAMRAGLFRPEVLVDLKEIPAMRGIRRDGDLLVIGATTTHREMAGDVTVAELVPVLAAVAARVGNARVRAHGTLGGNLCFAEPRSDLATLLVALDARASLHGPRGIRTSGVAELVAGPYFADKEPDELLVDVRIPPGRSRAAYRKLQVTERPTVGVAVVEDTVAGVCRVAVGAVGDVPVVHEFAGVAAVDAAAIADSVDPVDDVAGSPDYKRHVTAVFVRRAVRDLTEEVSQ